MILREPAFKVVRASHSMYKKGAFVLIEPLVVAWESKRCVLTVGEGTFTNFSSVPFGFRNVFPVNGRHRLAAVAHDALYGMGGVFRTRTLIAVNGSFIQVKEDAFVYYSRKEADQLFYDLMIVEGVNKVKAWLMFRAVRLFGKSHWSA